MNTGKYDGIVKLCREFAAGRDLYCVTRIQQRKDLAFQINNGQTEEVSTASLEGMGIQAFDSNGYMGFAASDRVLESIAAELLEKAAFLIDSSRKFQGETNREIFKLPPNNRVVELTVKYPYHSGSLTEIENTLLKMNREIAGLDPRLSVRTLLRVSEEEWRIARSDGTDVSFNTPRAFIYHSITAKSGTAAATTHANLAGIDLGIIRKPEKIELLKKRAVQAAGLALDLLSAANFPGGNYKLVIDYALAKGLAHEAFGHAAETDSLESSILGENGRLKQGMIVADRRLSIIDGPREGDYAYQPISALGVTRQTVKIVDHGVLRAGLADIFSASRAGVSPTGAERVESFFNLPIARMSNIRIEFENPIPLRQDFQSVTPVDLYRLLRANRLARPGEKVLYLTGFRGGQVNPAFGDFVFNCAAIYDLAEEPILYKPAIFSGKILSVLQSVSAAVGDLQLDVMGTCGKMGQGVPSCGGSHYFLVIEKNPEIMIGGE